MCDTGSIDWLAFTGQYRVVSEWPRNLSLTFSTDEYKVFLNTIRTASNYNELSDVCMRIVWHMLKPGVCPDSGKDLIVMCNRAKDDHDRRSLDLLANETKVMIYTFTCTTTPSKASADVQAALRKRNLREQLRVCAGAPIRFRDSNAAMGYQTNDLGLVHDSVGDDFT